MGLLALTEISANVAKPTTEPVVKKAAAENAAKKKPLVYGEAPVRRLHTKKEANVLVRDAAMHEWLRKRLPKNAAPRPRMYFTKFRRETLQKCFESIDRDGSGLIDSEELIFALTSLGLDTTHAAALLKEGDIDNDGNISMPEFFALVATVTAREASKKRDPNLWKKPMSEQEREKMEEEDAVAHSVRDLVDRASTFPIGLMANTLAVTSLVSSYDPDGYQARYEKEVAALELEESRDAVPFPSARSSYTQVSARPDQVEVGSPMVWDGPNSVDGSSSHSAASTRPSSGRPSSRASSKKPAASPASATSSSPPPILELSREGHLKLPLVAKSLPPSVPVSEAGGDTARDTNRNRASSAPPLKSTKFDRWLQRGASLDRVKGAQQMLNHAQGGGGGSQKKVGTSKLKTAGAAVMAAAGTKKETAVVAPAAIKPQRSRVRSSSLPGREAVIQTLPTIPSVPAIAVDLS